MVGAVHSATACYHHGHGLSSYAIRVDACGAQWRSMQLGARVSGDAVSVILISLSDPRARVLTVYRIRELLICVCNLVAGLQRIIVEVRLRKGA